ILQSCGTSSLGDFDASIVTQTVPFINRVQPNNGRAGDTITVFGFGFSTTSGNNVVVVGGGSAAAANYALVNPAVSGEIEQFTFTVPTNAATGATTLIVEVFGNASNGVAFTVNP
ncbi:MAG: IPT/TIG domain-containing protein, partial [Deltaproteobacteria bacterium]|nr:IPT/TIG domain-containing protein [Deltaproteobacteria bacterium]